ncbi:membrane protein [Iodidimonas muriae]|uniref:Membrane protein n=1 Tax=Iodidimonas muriae TaxID=261467 RepID=A0ABQ2L9B3_9PROT|nr:EI24 domain-containing protein [Iodidimonas muriae]GGO07428.1 membrane protein [Iodidimonas muriae]
MMMIRAMGLALNQLGDPAFRRVIILGLGLSALVFAAILAGMIALLPLIPESGIGWLDSAVDWLAGLGLPILFLLVLWLLFPAVMTTITSFFLDDVVDAVEAKHYPQAAGWRRSPLIEAIWLAVRLSVLIIVVNIVALPFYLALLFTGFGTLILYLALNSYLLGREYFEMVAVRHASLRDAGRLRKSRRDRALMGGLGISLLFMIPLVNLIAPVLGIAMMVHLFHASRAQQEPAL